MNTTLSQREIDLQELNLELLLCAMDDTLTETRYDEIIGLLAQANFPDPIFAQSIFQGKRAWQQKHWVKYGFVHASSTKFEEIPQAASELSDAPFVSPKPQAQLGQTPNKDAPMNPKPIVHH